LQVAADTVVHHRGAAAAAAAVDVAAVNADRALVLIVCVPQHLMTIISSFVTRYMRC
jgi:hypothetical protein